MSTPIFMNPNRSPIHPDCFRDYKQYSGWLGLARAAREACTVCEDCTKQYKEKMIVQNRCHEEWILVHGIIGKPLKAKK
jgi:hypothetical protein